ERGEVPPSALRRLRIISGLSLPQRRVASKLRRTDEEIAQADRRRGVGRGRRLLRLGLGEGRASLLALGVALTLGGRLLLCRRRLRIVRFGGLLRRLGGRRGFAALDHFLDRFAVSVAEEVGLLGSLFRTVRRAYDLILRRRYHLLGRRRWSLLGGLRLGLGLGLCLRRRTLLRLEQLDLEGRGNGRGRVQGADGEEQHQNCVKQNRKREREDQAPL